MAIRLYYKTIITFALVVYAWLIADEVRSTSSAFSSYTTRAHGIIVKTKASFSLEVLANCSARSEFFICLWFLNLKPSATNWIKTKEKIASFKKVRKWKTAVTGISPLGRSAPLSKVADIPRNIASQRG